MFRYLKSRFDPGGPGIPVEIWQSRPDPGPGRKCDPGRSLVNKQVTQFGCICSVTIANGTTCGICFIVASLRKDRPRNNAKMLLCGWVRHIQPRKGSRKFQ